MDEKAKLGTGLKLALDLGPLGLFLAANALWGIFAATGVFMAAMLAAMAVSYTLTRHLPLMAIVSGVLVLVFGTLTLTLQNETFIKVKPTILYVLFATLLLAGLAFRKPWLAMVFDSVLDIDGEGWRKLTWRWAFFFLALAVLNEVVWRTQSTSFWATFKGAAILLTFGFAALQYPLIRKHALPGSPLREGK